MVVVVVVGGSGMDLCVCVWLPQLQDWVSKDLYVRQKGW